MSPVVHPKGEGTEVDPPGVTGTVVHPSEEAVLEGKNLESVTMRLVRREKRLQLEEGSLEAEDQKEKARKKMFKIIGSALAAQLERRKQAG